MMLSMACVEKVGWLTRDNLQAHPVVSLDGIVRRSRDAPKYSAPG